MWWKVCTFMQSNTETILHLPFYLPSWYMDISITRHYHLGMNLQLICIIQTMIGANFAHADILIISMGDAVSGSWWSSNRDKVLVDLLFSSPSQAHLLASFHFHSLFSDIGPIVLDDRNFYGVYYIEICAIDETGHLRRNRISEFYRAFCPPPYLNFSQ